LEQSTESSESKLFNVKQKVVDKCMGVCSELQQQEGITQSADSMTGPLLQRNVTLEHYLRIMKTKSESREEQEQASSDDSTYTLNIE